MPKFKALIRQRRYNGESGNVFFTLFGAVALVGVIGVATATLMRGPVGTVVNINARTKADSQLEIARKLVALDASQVQGDCDNDTFIEPAAPDVTTAGCSGLISGGGCIPASIGAAKTDPWGTLVGYCAWNHGSVTSGSGCPAGLLAGTNSKSKVVIAVISAGPDRHFQTTCAADPTYITTAAGSDDIVESWTFDEAETLSGGGLWELQSGNPNAITTTKSVDIAHNSTFASGTTATFQGAAAFNAGSQLSLSSGALFLLPTQSTLTTCNAANAGSLRRYEDGTTTPKTEKLQICDALTTPPEWDDVGGAGAGLSIDNLSDAISDISGGANVFLGAHGGDAMVAGSAARNVTVGINSGKAITTGTDNTLLGYNNGTSLNTGNGNILIGSNLSTPTGATSSYLDIGNWLYGNGGNIGIGTSTPAHKLDVNGSANFAGDTGVGGALSVSGASTLTGATTVGSTLGVTSDETLGGALSITGAISNPTSDVSIADSLQVSGATHVNNTLAVSGATTLNNGLSVSGDSTFNGNVGGTGTGAFVGDVSGASFRLGSITGGVGMFTDASNGMQLETNAVKRLQITESGLVGIGTTLAPATNLDVNGDIKIGNNAGASCTNTMYGAIRYSSSDKLQICSSVAHDWVTVGTSGGGGGNASDLWSLETGTPNIYYTNGFVGVGIAVPLAPLQVNGDFLNTGAGGGTVSMPVSGAGTRMVFDADSGAFRAGTVSGTEWDTANVGAGSFAAGSGNKASGPKSAALGEGNIADGEASMAWGDGIDYGSNHASNLGSTAFGEGTQASGIASTSWGFNTIASGQSSTALGQYVTVGDGTANDGKGDNSIGMGLTGIGSNPKPEITGTGDFGIFMQDQHGKAITSNNTMALLGGQFIVDPNSQATLLTAAPTTAVDVNGGVGATQYCDVAGANCFTAASVHSGAVGVFEDVANVVRPTSGTVNYASADFLFGSPTEDYDGVASHASRIIFNKAKSAFRAGTTANQTFWDNAHIGQYSVAMGFATQAGGIAGVALNQQSNASGNDGLATGYQTTASGLVSTALGSSTTAKGDESLATGLWTTASGQGSTALGAYATTGNGTANAAGNYSLAVGLTSTNTAAYPTVTGTGDFGIFMQDQHGKAIAANNTMALLGGALVVDPNSQATLLAAATGTGGALALDINGNAGATKYCDAAGNNCFTAADISAGSANAPGTNTQVIFNSNGKFGAASGLVYTSAGRVGIGTTSPAKPLEISNTAGAIRLTNPSLSADKSIDLYVTDRGDGGAALNIGRVGGGLLNINLSNSTYLNQMLVAPTFSVASGGSVTSNGNAPLLLQTQAVRPINFATNSVQRMIIDSSGNVGIGTTAPASGTGGQLMLDVNGPAGATKYCDAAGNNCFTPGAGFGTPGTPLNSIQFNSGGTFGGNANFIWDPATQHLALDIGGVAPTHDISFGGDVAHTEGMERKPTAGAGNAFTLNAGGAYLGGSNLAGGNLILSGGTATGTGTSGIIFQGAGYGATGTTDSSPAEIGRLTGGGYLNLTGTYNGGDSMLAATGTATPGAGTRMVWYPQKAAFRAGGITGTQWDDANVGVYSIAMGHNTTAGNYSVALGDGALATGSDEVALGNAASASGNSSIAMGYGAYANGDFSTAIGSHVTASGAYSTILGNYATAGNGTASATVGSYSLAMGLTSTSTTAYPQITGSGDLGIFMQDQHGKALAASNTMALLGGKLVVDPNSQATLLAVNGSTAVDVNGSVGATQYCDVNGANCFVPGSASSLTAAGTNGQVQFNSGGAFGASSNFFWDNTNGRLGIGTNAPTHALSLASGAAETFYNTTDQITNYERARAYWNLNVFTISTEEGGTGGTRDLRLQSATQSAQAWIDINRSNTPYVNMTTQAASTNTGNFFQATPLQNAASGSQVGFAILPTITQTGTANYTSLLINSTETTTGSGLKLLQDWQVGGTSLAAMTDTGKLGIGTNAPTTDIMFGGSAARTIAVADNGTSAGSGLTVQGGSTTGGSNINGGSLTLSGGQASGTGTSGIIFKGAGYGTTGTAASAPAEIGRLTGGGYLNLTGTVGAGDTMLAATGTATPGAGTRMVWYPNKGAFRAGYVNGTQWDDSNIGIHSIALGNNAIASGLYSVALGHNVTSNAQTSVAFGEGTTASGTYAMAWGQNTTASSYTSTAGGQVSVASGDTSTAIGRYLTASGSYSNAMGSYTQATGNYSAALGLSGVSTTAYPTVSGTGSYGIFMQDQHGKALAASNTMALLGGKLVVDPNSQATLLTAASTTAVDINGAVGATQYCDVSGANCFVPGSAGSLSAAGTNGQVQFNSGGAFGASSNFFWDNTNGRLGIGTNAPTTKLTVTGGYITANGGITSPGTGSYSEAFGNTATTGASTSGALAVGYGATAAGAYSNIAIGYGASAATGYYSMALGWSANAGNNWAIAIGKSASANGAGSPAIAIGASTSAGYAGDLVIGDLATATAANQMILGSANTYNSSMGDVRDVYIGGGVTNTTPHNLTINATGGSGSDIAGANMTLAGGKGTGAGVGGSLIFSTANAGASGATLQSLTEKMRITPTGYVGIGTSAPTTDLMFGVGATRTIAVADNGTSAGSGLTVQGGSTTGGSNINGGNLTLSGGQASGTGTSGIIFKGAGYGATGTAVAAPAEIGRLTGGGYLNLTGTNGSGDTMLAATGTATPGAGTRMFWYPYKGAFRAGYVGGTQWDDANIGLFSAAFGEDSVSSGESSFAVKGNATADFAVAMAGGNATSEGAVALGASNADGFGSLAMAGAYAEGDLSIAMGSDSEADGPASVAIGAPAYALGGDSTAIGTFTTASGLNSTALGSYVNAGDGTAGDGKGDYSLAVGLTSTTAGSLPQVTGTGSYGIFMQDQHGKSLAASNTMALLGGKLVVDPNSQATLLTAASTTAVDINGAVGATQYCDVSGANCFVPGSASSLTAAGTNGQVQFNSGGAFGADSNYYWDNTNKRLGIGTNAPAVNLHLKKDTNSTVNELLRLENAGSGAGAGEKIGFYSGATQIGQIQNIFDTGSVWKLQLGTYGALTALTINQVSDVGVGSTSPLAGLDVQTAQTATSGVAYGGRYQQTLTAAAAGDRLYGLYINPTYVPGSYAPTDIDLGFDGTAARTIAVARNTTAGTAGQGLTITAGGATAGTTSKAGGNLTLNSGVSTGANHADVVFKASGSTTGTTADNALTELMRIRGDSQGVQMGSGSYADGSNSTAMGFESEAGNEGSTAMGYGSQAYGYASTAMGYASYANGDYSTSMGDSEADGLYGTSMGYISIAGGNYSTAMGQFTMATGIGSTALGQYAAAGNANGTTGDGHGNWSMAMGLTNTSTTAYPQITGTGDLGIFMQDQHGKSLAASNTMALLGGNLVVDPNSQSTLLAAATGTGGALAVDVNGNVGATKYCDAAGNNCFTPGSVASGGTAASPAGSVQFNSGGSFGGNANFFWNNTSGYLGIGTNVPTAPLDIRQASVATAGYGDGVRFVQTINAAANNDVLSALYINPTYALNSKTGVTTYDIGFNGAAARTIGVRRNAIAGTAGQGLTISAGGATAGASSKAGGNLTLASGISTGTNTADIVFKASGAVSGTAADNALTEVLRIRGDYDSLQMYNTEAAGIASTALGEGSVATGEASTALGNSSSASGLYSTALGEGSYASGEASTTMGLWSSAQGDYSVAAGGCANATGEGSVALNGDCGNIYDNGGTASGVDSLAAGVDSVASGDISTAFGRGTSASGGTSMAWGLQTSAAGGLATAWGNETIASGSASTAFGQFVSAGSGTSSSTVGAYSVAMGLTNSSPTGPHPSPSITGSGDLGIFMQDQRNKTLSASNTMALLGGTLVVDPNSQSTLLAAATGTGGALAVDVNGNVGATKYCDAAGNNCFTPASVGGSGGTAASPAGSVQFNSGGSFGGSTSFTWDKTNNRLGLGTATPTNRLTVDGAGLAGIRTYNAGSTTGGGMFIGALADDIGSILVGGEFNGGGFVAHGVDASDATFTGGSIQLHTNAGLTSGSTYTPATRLDITPAGNIGIGTTTPSAPLDVEAATTAASGYGDGMRLVQTINAAANNDVLSALYINPTYALNSKTGVTTYDIGFNGTAARTIGMRRNTTAGTAGKGLTIGAGGAAAGGSNLAGGNLTLNSGVSTGTGTGDIIFQASGAAASGTTDNALTEVLRIRGDHQSLQMYGGNAVGLESAALGGSSTDGSYSFAAGNSEAEGDYSVATGNGSNSYGLNSVAMGQGTEADGTSSTSLGGSSDAVGNYSTAVGSSYSFGQYSVAMGSSDADGDFSTSMGQYTSAEGVASTAMGSNTIAAGDYSTALGNTTTASGNGSLALGQYVTAGNGTASSSVGAYSVAMGLTGTSTTAYPKITGAGDLGIFMQDQHGKSLAASNTMALLGGTLVVDPNNQSTLLAAATGTGGALAVDVNGNVGATKYCDAAGNNCFTPGSVGSSSAPGASTNIIFNSGGSLGANSGLVYSSGNVGIGISSPQNRLHVYSTTSADGLSVDGTNNPAIVLRSGGVIKGYAPAIVTTTAGFFNDAAIGDFAFRSEANNILFGRAGGSSTMAIVGQKIGIGTAAPAAPLDVETASTAASGYGDGMRLVQTINAAANNDVLSALYINPTYALNSKTGVTTYDLGFNGTAARTIGMRRNATAGTAGKSLTIGAGGAYSGGSNLAGGDLILSGGTATGGGNSGVSLRVARGGGPAAADNVPVEGLRVAGMYYSTDDVYGVDVTWGAAGASATGVGDMAGGYHTTASSYYSMAWGSNTVASQSGSTAWGASTTSEGLDSTTWGLSTVAQGDEATAWGYGSTANGFGATAWGGNDDFGVQGGSASNDGATAFGSLSNASGGSATAWGGTPYGDAGGIASGDSSTAWGEYTTASGQTSTAFGNNTVAASDNTVAWGNSTTASGANSTAFGQWAMAGNGTSSSTVGAYSVAMGLTNTSTTAYPKITGAGDLGIFMQDQHGKALSASNTMALLGGKMVIDPNSQATLLAPAGSTALDVNGAIGASQYCDATGANCFTAAGISGGGGTAAGSTGSIQFNSGGVFAGSTSLTWDKTNKRLGIGTASPGKSLVLSQSSTSDGFQFTGNSIGGTSSGSGFLLALGYNATGNKQFWIGDTDYAGSSGGAFTRFINIGGVPLMDATNGSNTGYGVLNFGQAGQYPGSHTVVGAWTASGTFADGNSQPASLFQVNGGMAVGHGYYSNTAPTDGIIVAGNVGVGTTAPSRPLDIANNVTHNVSGTASQLSVRGTANTTNKLNIGYDTTSNYGFIEAVNESTAWQNLVLQPTGGKVGIGTTSPGYTFQVGSAPILFADVTNSRAMIGDINYNYNNSYIDTNDGGTLAINNWQGNIVLGDYAGFNNGTQLIIDDPDNQIEATAQTIFDNAFSSNGEADLSYGGYSDPASGIGAAAKISAAGASSNPIASLATEVHGTEGANKNTYAGYFNNTSAVSGTGKNYGVYAIGTNDYFSGNVGIGVTSPTAYLTLKAGTATAGTAPLKFTAGTNLTTPEDGAIEYNGTHFYGTVGSTRYQLDQQSGGGAAGAFSGLTAATATNSIDNTAFAQTWNWNTLAGANGLKLASTSTAAASNAQTLLNIALSGANGTSTQTTYGEQIANTHTGSSSTNVGLSVSASGGSNNYGLIVPNGAVGIGTASPSFKLDVNGTVGNSAGDFVISSANGSNTLTAGNSAPLSLMIPNSGTPTIMQFGNSAGGAGDIMKFIYNAGTGALTWNMQNNSSYNRPLSIYNTAGLMVGSSSSALSMFDVNGGVAVGSYAGANAAPTNGMIVSGKVGIGTSSLAAGTQLTVNGGVAASQYCDTSGANCIVPGSSGSGTPGGSSGNVQFNNSSAFGGSSSLFWDNGNSRLGIGTSTPSFKLDVNGTVGNSAGDFVISSANGSNTLTAGNSSPLSLIIPNSGTPTIMQFGNSAGGAGDIMKFIYNAGTGALTWNMQNNGSYNRPLSIYNTAGLMVGSSSSAVSMFDVNGGVSVGSYAGANAAPTNGLIVSGKAGIGTALPTADLTIKAGTATAGTAPLKLTSGTNLTTPESGAIEYDGTHFYGTIGSTRYQLDQQSGGAAGALSGLTAATATNSIDNATFAQTWNWNTLAGANGLKLASTSTAAASNAQTLLNIAMSGANGTSTQTTYGEQIANTHTGTSSTNVGLSVTASGGTNNYAALFSGNVGIGTTTPTSLLDLGTYNGSNYTFKSGGFVLQPSALNNGFISDNSYYNGTSWTRINTGYASGFQFYNGQLLVNVADTGSGTFTQTSPLKADFTNSGTVALGGTINSALSNYSGATMVVLGTGSVGIGTTSPAAGTKLTVNGNIGASQYCDTSGANCIVPGVGGGTAAGSSGNVQFNNSGAFAGSGNLTWDNSNSRLAIGTTTPSAALHIVAPSSAGPYYAQMIMEPSASNNGTAVGMASSFLSTTQRWYFGTGSGGSPNNNNFRIYDLTNSGERFDIDTAGHIGLGLTTPSADLHIKAGTATAGTAPLKLTSGTNLTTPEDGAVEYNGTHFYGTVGSTRYQLDQQSGGGGGGGPGSGAITAISSNTTLTSSNYTVLVNAGSNNVTVTLPSASANSGRVFVIKRVDNSANDMAITASQNIDDQTTQYLYYMMSYTIQSDGTQWWITGQYGQMQQGQ